MSGHMNVGGSWKNLKTAYAKVNGEWKKIKIGYANVNGNWKEIFKSTEPLSISLYVTSSATSYKTATVTLSGLTSWTTKYGRSLRDGLETISYPTSPAIKCNLSTNAADMFEVTSATATGSGQRYRAQELIHTSYKSGYEGTFSFSSVFSTSDVLSLINDNSSISVSSNQKFDFTVPFNVVGAGYSTCVYDLYAGIYVKYRYDGSSTTNLGRYTIKDHTITMYPISNKTSIPIQWSVAPSTNFSAYPITIYPYGTL